MGENFETSIQAFDESKRDTLRSLVRGAAFSAPMLATFALDGKADAASAVSGLGNLNW